MSGPCMICGATGYAPSFGGPMVCPSCDCGNFGPDVVKRQGETIARLQSQIVEANERVHYAEGTAALAMKHRDEAEARLAEAQREISILRDVLMNPDPDSEPDNVHLHREKCDALDKLAEAKIALEAPTKEEITLRAQLAEARKALERINSDEKNCTDYCRRQAKAAWLGKPVRDLDEARSSWLTASVDASSLTDYEVKPSNEPTDAVLSSAIREESK